MKFLANLCYFEKKNPFSNITQFNEYPFSTQEKKKENNKEIHILFCDKLKLKILFYFLKMREEK